MVQGTASSVGKSVICTAICRILTEDGKRVAPFKAQNMSLNSYITEDGLEIGRAQGIQGEACKIKPTVEMNPILLKPTADNKSQIVVKGKVLANLEAQEYYSIKGKLKRIIKECYFKLLNNNDVVVIEGAGSPAEINLNKDDIVNMGMAKMANSPVLLVADIDKGGVFASIYGTVMLLDEEDRKRIKGIIINKFRGDIEILKPGLKTIENLVNIPVIGVIPYFLYKIEDEDSVTDWARYKRQGDFHIAVIKLPRISNFTDINPLLLYENIDLKFVELQDDLGEVDLIILPGSKNTIEDLQALKKTGMFDKILKAYKKGVNIFGICGGYQMLGKEIKDCYGVESSIKSTNGFNLLPITTEFRQDKITTLSDGEDMLFNCPVKGYEIHMGKTEFVENSIYPLIKVEKEGQIYFDGCFNEDKNVFGTYFHGIFENQEFTLNLLNLLRVNRGKRPEIVKVDYEEHKEKEYTKLAQLVRENLDIKKLYQIIEEGHRD
ncbi:adenosylcobyric acid synthase (glutamine-hydrolysing) [Anaerobranca gottschalkii DSM 13577]|uniref:Cobyric acid synthase n=2 Tax=Anaerobranca gottschalkii TaxID=108328 RepID=A0A1I0A2L6_9FIRM|nr:adenosylcobyric acid synthase (glutamine-hydrolysing) [Anaerobranca gottschalkii DSM 13577]